MKTKSRLNFVFAVVFTSFLLVATVTFAKFPVSPSLIFIYCVCISFIRGDIKSLIFSGICGLFLDFLCNNTFFTNTCFFAYISLGCAELNKRVVCSLKTSLLCVFISTLLFLSFGVLVNFGVETYFFWFSEKIFPEALYSTALTVVIYPLAVLSTGKQRCLCEKNKS